MTPFYSELACFTTERQLLDDVKLNTLKSAISAQLLGILEMAMGPIESDCKRAVGICSNSIVDD